jgi:hypothetical protein
MISTAEEMAAKFRVIFRNTWIRRTHVELIVRKLDGSVVSNDWVLGLIRMRDFENE